MRRAQWIIVLALAASLGCGARTELDVSGADGSGTNSGPGSGPGAGGFGPTRTYRRIGILGGQGAYDESTLLGFLAKQHTVTRTQTDGGALGAEQLDGFDLVILDNLVRDYTADEAHAFERWVHAGGGVISLTGFVNQPSDTERPNSLLAELGVAYREGLITDPPGEQLTSFTAHPLTKNLASIIFEGGYAVTHDAPATEIAFSGLVPVAVAAAHGQGRVYLWGDEWVEYSMEWTTPEPGVFWTDALRWLSHED